MTLAVSNRSEGGIKIFAFAAEHQGILNPVDLPNFFESPIENPNKVIFNLADLVGLQAAFTSALVPKISEVRGLDTHLVLAAPMESYYHQLSRLGLRMRIPIFSSEAKAIAAFNSDAFKPTDSWQARSNFLMQASEQSYLSDVPIYDANRISQRPVETSSVLQSRL